MGCSGGGGVEEGCSSLDGAWNMPELRAEQWKGVKLIRSGKRENNKRK